MKTKQIRDLNTSLGTILKSLGAKGGILEIPGKKGYVLLPLDDEMVDYCWSEAPS